MFLLRQKVFEINSLFPCKVKWSNREANVAQNQTNTRSQSVSRINNNNNVLGVLTLSANEQTATLAITTSSPHGKSDVTRHVTKESLAGLTWFLEGSEARFILCPSLWVGVDFQSVHVACHRNTNTVWDGPSFAISPVSTASVVCSGNNSKPNGVYFVCMEKYMQNTDTCTGMQA